MQRGTVDCVARGCCLLLACLHKELAEESFVRRLRVRDDRRAASSELSLSKGIFGSVNQGVYGLTLNAEGNAAIDPLVTGSPRAQPVHDAQGVGRAVAAKQQAKAGGTTVGKQVSGV